MGSRITDDLVLNSMTMSYWRRRPSKTVRLHSDQGSQYTSGRCQRLLKALDIKPSMSRRGNCWDNAVAESFFSNLKNEEIRGKCNRTRDDGRRAVFKYIELLYNPKRRHTHNGRVAPTVYEQKFLMK
ncbi:MAG: DDE-type integrase/transposase/recombinase [Gammaproteobacteria bacterium]